jgi:pyruvate dehydrogenase (quinone)
MIVKVLQVPQVGHGHGYLRGVAHLTLPNDLQVAKAGENPYVAVGLARSPATAPIIKTLSGKAAVPATPRTPPAGSACSARHRPRS